MLPIIINIVFGEPFFMGMLWQKYATVAIITLYLIYLLFLCLYLLNCFEAKTAKNFFGFFFPSFEKIKSFLRRKLRKNSGLRPTTGHLASNPLVWRLFYRGPKYIKVLI